MGASFITYIVKGPRTLDEARRAEAIVAARLVIDAVKEAFEKYEYGLDMPKKEVSILCKLTGLPDLESIERYEIGGLVAETVVDDLYETWKSSFRDVNTRLDPDDLDQRIVVAGQMSWGDEPDGAGYQSLKYAEACGLFEFFGIR